jgi:hypothetical protein
VEYELVELNAKPEKTEEDNKRIEDLKLEIKEKTAKKDSDEVKQLTYLTDKNIKIVRSSQDASIIGDTIGDPLKDTSGPSINILIKLSSIVSVVFGTFFTQTSFLIPHKSTVPTA